MCCYLIYSYNIIKIKEVNLNNSDILSKYINYGSVKDEDLIFIIHELSRFNNLISSYGDVFYPQLYFSKCLEDKFVDIAFARKIHYSRERLDSTSPELKVYLREFSEFGANNTSGFDSALSHVEKTILKADEMGLLFLSVSTLLKSKL